MATAAPVTQEPGVPLGGAEGDETYGIIAVLAAVGAIVIFGGIAMCCYGRWAAAKVEEERQAKKDAAADANGTTTVEPAADANRTTTPPAADQAKKDDDEQMLAESV